MLFALKNIVPSFRLDGKLAVLTGGSGGLAASIGRSLIAQGAQVALLDTNRERTDAAAAAMRQWAVDELHLKEEEVPAVLAWVCNIGSAQEVEDVFASVHTFHNNQYPNLLVNTAGYCENFPAEQYPAPNAENLLKVNGLGSFYVLQAFAKPLIANELPGSIVLVGSMLGVIVNDPQPQAMYNMSKAGVIHLTRSLACEWAKYNIRVNCLSPGYILTPLTKNVIAGSATLKELWEGRVPQKRMAEPHEFIGSILYLLNDGMSSYTTGHNLVVDGGYECW